jgi:hypothetical protein
VAAAAPTLCALKGVGTDVAGAVLVSVLIVIGKKDTGRLAS